ncbi:MAG: hypothetical protein Q7T80_07465 [Methanoregula sp.]|nr:hypothetical protein [Methanoregula sp.]
MMVLLAVAFVFFTPVASALLENADIPHSTGPLDKDKPEEISLLKSHTAYVGVMQQARMNGVIGYIDRISDGTGTANLQWIQEDYIAAASSIPLLYTSDEITVAREEMQTQSLRFFEETNIQMAAFNGTDTDMRASTSVTESDAETTFARMPDSVWLMKGSARLAAFNTSAEKRAALLLTLTRKGVDITKIREISDQIDARRTDLQVIVVKNQNGAIISLNSGIARLNNQFRNTVDEALINHEIQLKTTAMLAMK